MARMLAFVLLLAAHGARIQEKETPITRVVNLLKEMENTLNSEMDEDEKLYQQLSCWCTSGMGEKEAAVSEATEKIAELTASIESLTAKSAELKETISTTEKNVAANKDALATATAQRKKDANAFHNKELDQIQNLENMKAALTVMKKHDDAAFPQVESTSFLQVDDATEGWSPEDMSVVRKALKAQSVFMQDDSAYNPGYESQSGAILGVLKQMQETMAADLAEAQKKESLDAAAFDELRRAKTAEVEAGEKKAENKEDVLSDTDVKNAEAAEDKEQTEKVMADDQKFIVSLKSTCANANKNFELRKKARLGEIKAVSETIGILTSDEARDNQRATYGGAANFMQMRKVLSKIRASTRMSLAARAGLDNFDAIKKVMDDMINNLKKQQASEVEKNDECKELIHDNEMKRLRKQDDIDNLGAQIGELEQTIKQTSTRIEEAKAEINALQVSLQQASLDRKAENLEFQKTITDQTMTISILHKAMERLSKYYDAQFLQRNAHKLHQTPPVPQMEYKPSSGAGGIMSMIEKLIYDAKEMVKETKEGETEAQGSYEETTVDTFDSIAALMQEVSTKSEENAENKKALLQAQADEKDATADLARLKKTNIDIHGDCDYMMKNFNSRQEARSAEMEVLLKEQEILSGAGA